MKKNAIYKNILHFVFVILMYFTSIYFYYNNMNLICSIIQFITGFTELMMSKRKYGYFTNMLGIFSIIWFTTVGLSTMKLHWLQTTWKYETWLCLFLTYFFFLFSFSLKTNIKTKKNINNENISKKEIFNFYITVAIIPILSLILEIILNGGSIPVLSDQMESYQNFAVGKLHYLTVSCCLTLPISYILLKKFKISKEERLLIVFLDFISLVIPIVIVSRQLIIVSIIMFVYLMIYYNKKKEKILLISGLLFIAIGWIFIGSFRNQDNQYLKTVLRMKNVNINSVSNMQTYMYISMNYDNFNYNVGNIKEYQYGINSIYPIFGLTGLKKFFPSDWFLLYDRLDRIINVFNTYPLPMTPYMDGGPIFICLYMFIIGVICKKYELNDKNNINNLIFSIILKCCLTFSFFAAWFSRPTWWFYFIYIFILSKLYLKNHTLNNDKVVK